MFEGSTGFWDPVKSGLIVTQTRWQEAANSSDVKGRILLKK